MNSKNDSKNVKTTFFNGNKYEKGGLVLLKNKTKAPKLGKLYGQDVEPTGYYAIEKVTNIFDSNPNYETVRLNYSNPLYIKVTPDDLVSWKYELSKKYKAKGRKLTEKMLKEGYDVIITKYPEGDTGEIIVLDTSKIGKYGEGGLIAPNGRKSNLTPEQYKLVRTPQFKAWFGDWENDPANASQVVDENGEPMVVYHGTNVQFNEFDLKYFGKTDKGWYGKAFYFTPNSSFKFAEDSVELHGGEAIKLKLFLNIKNPLFGRAYAEQNSNLVSSAKDRDNDGVVILYDYGHELENEIAEILVWKSEQIKLADGTNTTFDGNNPDIRFEDGGLIAPNGRKSNLTPEQYKLVRTPEFKKFFGDWENDPANASQVVDENGEPLVVHHGTKYDFNTFRDDKLIWTTPEIAYIDKMKGLLESNRVIDLFANSRKILDLTKYGYKYYDQKTAYNIFLGYGIKLSGILTQKFGSIFYSYLQNHTEELKDQMMELGYDGIKVKVHRNYDFSFGFLQPNQIKLADGSNTTFDGNNPDIRYNGGGQLPEDVAIYKLYQINLSTPDQTINVNTTDNESEAYKDYDQVDKSDFNEYDLGENGRYKELTAVIHKYKFVGELQEDESIEDYKDSSYFEDTDYWELVSEDFEELERMKVESLNVNVDSDALLQKIKSHYKADKGYARIPIGNKWMTLRLKDHSGNVRNKTLDDSKYFLSVVIANKDATAHFKKSDKAVKGSEEIYFDSTATKEDIIKEIDEIIKEYKQMQSPKYADGGKTDFGKVLSSSSRFRPHETIYFNPPLIGANGVKLISYTWAYEWTMQPNWEGEMVGKRVSNWEQAEKSAETGRDIVHKYTVEFKDGKTSTVSSDSVPIVLGYLDKKQSKVLPNLITASKTLAKQKLELSIMKAKRKEYDDAIQEIKSRGIPPLIIKKGDEDGRTRYTIGEGSCIALIEKSTPAEIKYQQDERTECALRSYLSIEVKKMGIDEYVAQRTTYDLEKRIERQEKKIKEILSKDPNSMEDGGFTEIGKLAKGMSVSDVARLHNLQAEDLREQLIMGIETEMEHTDNPEVAKAIALDHLAESPDYYNRLKQMEQNIDLDKHYEEISAVYALGGNVGSVLSFNTPTGEPSELNYLQQVLVRTKAFKEWFGDWESAAKQFVNNGRKNFKAVYKDVSKVVNSRTLEPKVLFHGTRAEKEFFTFDVSQEEGIGRPYGYFAYNEEYSENFTISSQRGQRFSRPYMYKCFVNIKNPFYAINTDFYRKTEDAMYWKLAISKAIAVDKYKENYDAEKLNKTLETVISQIGDYLNSIAGNQKVPFWGFMASDTKKSFKFFLNNYLYDGVFYFEELKENYDVDNPAEFTEAVTIFEPNQVKLADGRNLNFDPMNNDMRYEDGGRLGDMQSPIANTNVVSNLRSTLLSKKYAEGGSVVANNLQDGNDGKKGGYFKGRSHAEGGIKAYNKDTGQPIEVEGEEVIITKGAVKDPKKREFEGQMMTNKEILSEINQSGGGVSFARGGEMSGHDCGCNKGKYASGGELNLVFKSIEEPFNAANYTLEDAKRFVDMLVNKLK